MYFPTKKGSALLISLVVLTLVTAMSAVFFEKLFRFSQASEGIENSNIAYYKALGSIESSLYGTNVDKYTPWAIVGSSSGSYITSGSTLTVFTGSRNIPEPGLGNSPYDSNYNLISIGEPVQLVIPDGFGNWSNVHFYFRIPEISTTSSTTVDPGSNNEGFVLWTFASSGASLFASGETQIFLGSDINDSSLSIGTKYGNSNSGSNLTLQSFYQNGEYVGTDGSSCVGYLCTLKLSLIKPVPTTDAGRSVSFLEYKIVIDPSLSSIPLQYMTLNAEGYAYGFLRQRTFQFPQITTNTALDFAVLQ